MREEEEAEEEEEVVVKNMRHVEVEGKSHTHDWFEGKRQEQVLDWRPSLLDSFRLEPSLLGWRPSLVGEVCEGGGQAWGQLVSEIEGNSFPFFSLQLGHLHPGLRPHV